jgi:methionyl-tRNA formyltransferase
MGKPAIFLGMKITFLSDKGSWKNKAILGLVQKLRKRRHKVSSVHGIGAISRGDLLFILGFFKIVPPAILKRNKTNLVVHESALPKGRGWSPVTWGVLEGAKTIPMTLFEAVEKVDAGKIYLRESVRLRGDELLPEIHSVVAAKTIRLCEKLIAAYPAILKRGMVQRGKATYYPQRRPKDSRLDPGQSIARQFNLLRVVHNDVYPAYFTLRGQTYTLKIEKKKN